MGEEAALGRLSIRPAHPLQPIARLGIAEQPADEAALAALQGAAMEIEAGAVDVIHRGRALIRLLELAGLLEIADLPGLGVIMAVRKLARLRDGSRLDGLQQAVRDQLLAARHIVRYRRVNACCKRRGQQHRCCGPQAERVSHRAPPSL